MLRIDNEYVNVNDDGSDIDTDTDSSLPASGAAAAANQNNVPYKKILELFNSTCVRLAKIKTIEGQRQKAVAARFKSHGLEAFQEVFIKANKSDFLCGSGSKNFVATFDWLMKADNFNKVREGNYDERIPSQHGANHDHHQDTGDPFLKYAMKEYENAIHGQ